MHEKTTADTHVWLTPRYIIDELGPFDLDPCAATVRPFDCAERNLTVEDDGLKTAWLTHHFVWCNPPYGKHVGAWLERMVKHGNGIALVFARTDTKAMQRALKACDAVLFVADRIRFMRPDGNDTRKGGGAGGAPSMFLAFGKGAVQRLGASSISGVFFERTEK